MPPTPKRRGSHLLLDEYFASGDDRFVDELLLVDEPLKLQGRVERWKVDPRPWAMAMQWRYLAAPWTTPGHNVVVKRLYKAAILHEAAKTGLEAQNRDGHPDFANHIAGMLAFVRMVSPQQAEPLVAAWRNLRRDDAG